MEENTIQKKEVKTGLNGWLALLGVGLILQPFNLISKIIHYIPLLNQNYVVPGLFTIITFEFIIYVIWLIADLYILYLYFKKNKKFPLYFTIYWIVIVIYSFIDPMITSFLDFSVIGKQNSLNSAISDGWGVFWYNLIISIIWVWYIRVSAKVKATFINN